MREIPNLPTFTKNLMWFIPQLTPRIKNRPNPAQPNPTPSSPAFNHPEPSAAAASFKARCQRQAAVNSLAFKTKPGRIPTGGIQKNICRKYGWDWNQLLSKNVENLMDLSWFHQQQMLMKSWLRIKVKLVEISPVQLRRRSRGVAL